MKDSAQIAVMFDVYAVNVVDRSKVAQDAQSAQICRPRASRCDFRWLSRCSWPGWRRRHKTTWTVYRRSPAQADMAIEELVAGAQLNDVRRVSGWQTSTALRGVVCWLQECGSRFPNDRRILQAPHMR